MTNFAHGGNIHVFARELGLAPEDLLDFSASINPLGLPKGARAAYRQAVRRIAHYPEPYAESLTQALAEYHGLAPTQIVVGNGSTQLIYALVRTLAARRVLLLAPLFSEYRTALQASGVKVDHFLLRPPAFALVLERLAQVLTEQHYDAVVITNPNSPTGVLTQRTCLEEAIRLCQRVGTKLIVDEAFVDWHEEASLKHVAVRSPQVIVLRSLTKFFALPGLRVGYALGQAATLKPLRSHIEPWSVNVMAQEIGRACLQDRAFIVRSRAFMEKERTWLHARLQAVPGLTVFPSSANFLLLRIDKQKMSARRLADLLASKRLLVRDCGNFYGLGRQFVRVAVRRRADNRRLVDVLADLCS